jgi:hypothetical protein
MEHGMSRVCRAGSLTFIARELAKDKSDLMGVLDRHFHIYIELDQQEPEKMYNKELQNLYSSGVFIGVIV